MPLIYHTGMSYVKKNIPVCINTIAHTGIQCYNALKGGIFMAEKKNRTKANYAINKRNYDKMEFYVIKGQKEVIYQYVEQLKEKEVKDMSFNKYINHLIYKDMGIPVPTVKDLREKEKKENKSEGINNPAARKDNE